MKAVGIDFGTTNCVLAHLEGATTQVVPIDEPPGDWANLGFDLVLPSVFGLQAGTPLFGWEAKKSFGPTVQAVKRMLATDESVMLDGKPVYVDEVIAMLFAHIQQRAAATGLDFDQAVVTIPANSKGPARYRTKICAGLSGIDVLTLINEPTAAAMAYGLQAQSDANIMVYDFGGGTLDVTLLKATDGVFMEMASKGIGQLGGLDFDRELRAKVLQTIPDHSTWSQEENRRFELATERAKIKLTKEEETSIELPRGGYHRVTRAQFEEVVRPLVERSRGPIEQCLSDTGLTANSIDALVMVGGTSKVPAVRRFVSEIMGREPSSGVDPMTAVGEGAAIAAAVLTGELETNDFLVGTEHALGTVVATPSGSLEFSPIIGRNHKIPARGAELFFPIRDHQDVVHVRVMEGDQSKPYGDEDNVTIWEQDVPIPEPRPRGEISFEIEFELDIDGIIWVTIKDVERDLVLPGMDRVGVTFGVTGDKRELVEIAGRVTEAMESTAPGSSTGGTPMDGTQDPEVAELLAKARDKVLPFLDESQAAPINQLIAVLEGPESADSADAKQALETELRKYTYLL